MASFITPEAATNLMSEKLEEFSIPNKFKRIILSEESSRLGDTKELVDTPLKSLNRRRRKFQPFWQSIWQNFPPPVFELCSISLKPHQLDPDKCNFYVRTIEAWVNEAQFPDAFLEYVSNIKNLLPRTPSAHHARSVQAETPPLEDGKCDRKTGLESGNRGSSIGRDPPPSPLSTHENPPTSDKRKREGEGSDEGPQSQRAKFERQFPQPTQPSRPKVARVGVDGDQQYYNNGGITGFGENIQTRGSAAENAATGHGGLELSGENRISQPQLTECDDGRDNGSDRFSEVRSTQTSSSLEAPNPLALLPAESSQPTQPEALLPKRPPIPGRGGVQGWAAYDPVQHSKNPQWWGQQHGIPYSGSDGGNTILEPNRGFQHLSTTTTGARQWEQDPQPWSSSHGGPIFQWSAQRPASMENGEHVMLPRPEHTNLPQSTYPQQSVNYSGPYAASHTLGRENATVADNAIQPSSTMQLPSFRRRQLIQPPQHRWATPQQPLPPRHGELAQYPPAGDETPLPQTPRSQTSLPAQTPAEVQNCDVGGRDDGHRQRETQGWGIQQEGSIPNGGGPPSPSQRGRQPERYSPYPTSGGGNAIFNQNRVIQRASQGHQDLQSWSSQHGGPSDTQPPTREGLQGGYQWSAQQQNSWPPREGEQLVPQSDIMVPPFSCINSTSAEPCFGGYQTSHVGHTSIGGGSAVVGAAQSHNMMSNGHARQNHIINPPPQPPRTSNSGSSRTMPTCAPYQLRAPLPTQPFQTAHTSQARVPDRVPEGEAQGGSQSQLQSIAHQGVGPGSIVETTDDGEIPFNLTFKQLLDFLLSREGQLPMNLSDNSICSASKLVEFVLNANATSSLREWLPVAAQGLIMRNFCTFLASKLELTQPICFLFKREWIKEPEANIQSIGVRVFMKPRLFANLVIDCRNPSTKK